jgi:hypothetical protein
MSGTDKPACIRLKHPAALPAQIRQLETMQPSSSLVQCSEGGREGGGVEMIGP